MPPPIPCEPLHPEKNRDLLLVAMPQVRIISLFKPSASGLSLSTYPRSLFLPIASITRPLPHRGSFGKPPQWTTREPSGCPVARCRSNQMPGRNQTLPAPRLSIGPTWLCLHTLGSPHSSHGIDVVKLATRLSDLALGAHSSLDRLQTSSPILHPHHPSSPVDHALRIYTAAPGPSLCPASRIALPHFSASSLSCLLPSFSLLNG